MQSLRLPLIGALVLSIAVLMLVLPFTPSVAACAPTSVPTGYVPPTPLALNDQIAQAIERADIIVDGTMANNGEITVSKYFKGSGPATLHVALTDCDYLSPDISLHYHALFFLGGKISSSANLYYEQSFHIAVGDIVTRYVGHAPVPPTESGPDSSAPANGTGRWCFIVPSLAAITSGLIIRGRVK